MFFDCAFYLILNFSNISWNIGEGVSVIPLTLYGGDEKSQARCARLVKPLREQKFVLYERERECGRRKNFWPEHSTWADTKLAELPAWQVIVTGI